MSGTCFRKARRITSYEKNLQRERASQFRSSLGASAGVRDPNTHIIPIQLRNISVAPNPYQSPLTPLTATIFFAQSIGPVYSRGPVVCIWRRALRCSVGQATTQTVWPARRPATCERNGGSTSQQKGERRARKETHKVSAETQLQPFRQPVLAQPGAVISPARPPARLEASYQKSVLRGGKARSAGGQRTGRDERTDLMQGAHQHRVAQCPPDRRGRCACSLEMTVSTPARIT